MPILYVVTKMAKVKTVKICIDCLTGKLMSPKALDTFPVGTKIIFVDMSDCGYDD